MAMQEVTGANQSELEDMKSQYRTEPMYVEHDIPFDVAYCLTEIPNQPEDYDGPPRFCQVRAVRTDDEEWPRQTYNVEDYSPCCQNHGGDVAAKGRKAAHLLEDPRTVTIKHGAYTEDEHLIMDFDDDEQELYDSIMEDWPEIYNWPSRSEDPARYRILRRVAVNEVRAIREETYLDEEGEVYESPEFDEQGIQVGTTDEENPLAREYRLLMSEVTDQMKELGLTPKERQKMDTLASEADKDDAISEIARDALNSEEQDYDPDQFDGN
jgi:hypothetical protein